MRIKDVDFPSALLTAQKKGNLVVFGGAGVSMGHPANYPSFSGLVDQVAGAAADTRRPGEPDDVFLGRLKKQGHKVRERTRVILSKPESKPTDLHRAILRLFLDAAKVAVVTTNFDNHFTTAARELFGDVEGRMPEVFYAPALPVGSTPHGIVHLHGGVDKDPERMVLTDSDFGRAYLTEGWARRFLQDLFTNYIVLFIGYSHKDTVMTYLARGLPPSDIPRFALTPECDTEHWEYLGIVPVTYRVEPPNDHTLLTVAVTAWAEFASRSALEQEQQIRDIVCGPSNLDPETDDQLVEMLKEIHAVRFFTRYADSPEWLKWAERKGVLAPLFQPGRADDPISAELARWFAEKFMWRHAEAVLAVIQRGRQVINETLWEALAATLWRGVSSDTQTPRDFDSITLAKWIAVLSQSPHRKGSFEWLDYVLSSCRFPNDRFTALLLFEHLTSSHVRLEPSFSSLFAPDNQDGTDKQVTFQGSDYWLKEVWHKYFKANLASFAPILEPVLTSHIQRAHFLLRALGEADQDRDHISILRASIEPQSENGVRYDTDVLIDAARDMLEWMLENTPEAAHGVIDRWAASEVPLLKRLSVHGMTKSETRNADQKLAWILERDWLFTIGLADEVFQLLTDAYPHATEGVRSLVVKRAEIGYQGDARERFSPYEEAHDYAIIRLLRCLSDAAPTCQIVQKSLEALLTRNPKLERVDRPDVDAGTKAGPTSPLSVEELLAKEPHDVVDMLLNYQSESAFGTPSRRGLWWAVEDAIGKRLEWGLRLATVLAERHEWETGLWEHVLRGWSRHVSTGEAISRALDFILNNPPIPKCSAAISEMILEIVKNETTGTSTTCVKLAEAVADELWSSLEGETEGPVQQHSDWVTTAMNRPGGKVAQFWMHNLSRTYARDKANWAGIPLEFRERFGRVLAGESSAAGCGQVMITWHVAFFFSLDAAWTRQNVFPLLDWPKDPKRAERAWHGFLYNPHLPKEADDDLLPLLERAIPDIFSTLSDELSQSLVGILANTAVFISNDPTNEAWFNKFMKDTGSAERKRFAQHIGWILRDLTDEQIRDLWNRWLGRYWSERIDGIPVALVADDGEMGAMLEWALHLGPVFADAAERICRSPLEGIGDTPFYYNLAKSSLAAEQPGETAKILLHLLSNAEEPFRNRESVETLARKLIEANAPRADLSEICERMAALGCPNAVKVKALVDKMS